MAFTAHLHGGPRDGEQWELSQYEMAFFVADSDEAFDSPVSRKGMYAATRSAARTADEGGNAGDYEWQGWR